MSGPTKAELETRLKKAEDFIKSIAFDLECDSVDEIEDAIHFLKRQQVATKEHIEGLTELHKQSWDRETALLERQSELLDDLNGVEQRELQYECAIDVILNRIAAGVIS